MQPKTFPTDRKNLATKKKLRQTQLTKMKKAIFTEK